MASYNLTIRVQEKDSGRELGAILAIDGQQPFQIPSIYTTTLNEGQHTLLLSAPIGTTLTSILWIDLNGIPLGDKSLLTFNLSADMNIIASIAIGTPNYSAIPLLLLGGGVLILSLWGLAKILK